MIFFNNYKIKIKNYILIFTTYIKMKITSLFIIFFQLKEIVFSDINRSSLSDLNLKGNVLSLMYDVHFHRLNQNIINDVDFIMKQEHDLCEFMEKLNSLGEFVNEKQTKCVKLFESLTAKYLSMKMRFSDIITDSFEITDFIIKELSEFKMGIEKKQKFNNLFIKQLKPLIKEENNTELFRDFKQFKMVSKSSYNKAGRFKRVYRKIRKAHEDI